MVSEESAEETLERIVELVRKKINETGIEGGTVMLRKCDNKNKSDNYVYAIVFVPHPMSIDSGTEGGFVFYFQVSDGGIFLALKKFERSRGSGFSETGLAEIGTVIEEDGSFVVSSEGIRYPFKVNLVELILYSWGLWEPASNKFIEEIDKVRVHVKKLTEANPD